MSLVSFVFVFSFLKGLQRPGETEAGPGPAGECVATADGRGGRGGGWIASSGQKSPARGLSELAVRDVAQGGAGDYGAGGACLESLSR